MSRAKTQTLRPQTQKIQTPKTQRKKCIKLFSILISFMAAQCSLATARMKRVIYLHRFIDTIAFHFPILKSFNLLSIPSSLLNTTRHLFPSTSNWQDKTKTFTNGSFTSKIDSQALMFFSSYYPQYTSLSPLSQDILRFYIISVRSLKIPHE